MNIKIPRPYYTLPELAQKWRISGLDLQRAIMDSVVKPCVMLDVPLHPVDVVSGAAVVRPDAEMVNVRQWLYPVYPVQIEAFNYRFDLLCDMAEPVEGCTLYGLPEPLTLVDLMGTVVQAVVMAADVAQAEADLAPVADEDALATKQKNTLSVLVAAMSFELYGWEPGSDKSVGVTKLLQAVEALGMKVSYNTARNHINDCWQRAKPELS